MSAGHPVPEAHVPCPICGWALAPPEYDRHLRREHDLVVYRGVRRPLDETLDVIRFDLAGDPPLDLAWQKLIRLAREEHPKPAKWLAAWLAESWDRLSPARQQALFPQLLTLIGPGNDLLIARLAARPELHARRFALQALLQTPLTPTLHKAAKRLLLDRELDENQQAGIVVQLLAGAERLADRALRWFVHGLPRREAQRRLKRLREQVGVHSLVESAIDRHRSERRLACPRCGLSLVRQEMEQHLWEHHRSLLDGLTVREPWEVLEEWVDRYRATRDTKWLERCRVASLKLDPENGPGRLERLLLVRGIGDPLLLKSLLARAGEEHAACCPGCYALVPVPRETPALFVNLRPGRLSAGGYEVEIDERGVKTQLVVRTPEGILYQGLEPVQSRTPMGLVLLAGGPFALLAVVAALVWPGNPISVVFFLWASGIIVGLLAWLVGRFEHTSDRRAFDYAWSIAVPHLQAAGPDLAKSRFLAGLATLASSREWVHVPEDVLALALQQTLEAMDQRKAAPAHLAALCRLRAERAAAQGSDPVALVERWLALAFEGKIPLSFAQSLLEEWRADFWTAGQLARLRLRVLDRAFEAGFEVQVLLDVGRNAPALGMVLGIDAPRRLAALRLLWSLRATRPWDRFGEARTAFELAAIPGWIELFERHPDLILWQQPGPTIVAQVDDAEPERATIQLTLAGVWLGEELFATPATVIETRQRVKGVEMRIGPAVFRSTENVDELTRTLERWFRWAFTEFLPQVDRVRDWTAPSRMALYRAWGAVACPECRRYLLPRVGEVGVALEEPR